MYYTDLLLIILCSRCFVDASHFRGGTITWKPMNNNITAGNRVSIMITQVYSWTRSQIGCNSSMIAAQWPLINLNSKAGTGAYLMCNDSCSTSGGYVGNEVPITGYCSDYSDALDLTVSQRSDTVNLTTDANFTATFSTSGGWQTLALGSSAGWSLACVINLQARSDNGLINTPPVATCISYISVPVNILQTIQIPVLDADNDVIRCRFANGSRECLDACPPGSLPPGTSLTSSCTLTITGPIAGAYYLVAIQVEDFLTNMSTTPLSSVPLQFLIYVYNITNCTFKPLLVSDLSSNTCQGVQVGTNFTITLTAINRCDSSQTIADIATLSFPILTKSALVQNTTNTSLWSMTMTWMPTASQIGSQVFCAVASDSASVQSDQYCVTLFVGLNSVPICPGATTPPTTMVATQMTSVTYSSAVTTMITSQVSTAADMTTMEITSSASIVTQSSPPSSTASTKSPTNWPLIIGILLGALALALCCLLCCCCCCLKAPKMHRQRRRKNSRAAENNPPWQPLNVNPHQGFSERLNEAHHRQGQSNSGISRATDVTTIPINRPENPFINTQGFLKNKQLCENPPSRSCQLRLSAINREETHHSLTSNRRPSTTKDSTDSSLDSPSPANMTEVRRPPKPFTARTHQVRASTVLVTRVKRSASANRVGAITKMT